MLNNQAKTRNLFEIELVSFIDMNKPLVKMANIIDWKLIENEYKKAFSVLGAPSKTVRLMASLEYLKYTFGLSDEDLLDRWVENPYWQYFSGEVNFQHTRPINSSTLTKWRKRLKDNKLEVLLQATIKAGFETKTITKSSTEHVNVDTTVQEKNVTYPRIINNYYKLIIKIGNFCKSNGIKLKQTFSRSGKKWLRKYSGYVHANHFKRARRTVKKLKAFMRRIYNEMISKATDAMKNDPIMSELIYFYTKLSTQSRKSKNKLLSLHEPHVECIGKGKAHKKYEFGNKAGFVATSREGFILSAASFHGNPYDGHTLNTCLSMAEENILDFSGLSEVYVDLGYRKHDYEGEASVNIVGRSRKSLTKTQRKWYNRRSVIEAVIGNMKRSHRLDRNYLSGKEGDQINAVMAACGYNLRLIYRKIASKIRFLIQNPQISSKINLKSLLFDYRFSYSWKAA